MFVSILPAVFDSLSSSANSSFILVYILQSIQISVITLAPLTVGNWLHPGVVCSNDRFFCHQSSSLYQFLDFNIIIKYTVEEWILFNFDVFYVVVFAAATWFKLTLWALPNELKISASGFLIIIPLLLLMWCKIARSACTRMRARSKAHARTQRKPISRCLWSVCASSVASMGHVVE